MTSSSKEVDSASFLTKDPSSNVPRSAYARVPMNVLLDVC